MAKVYQAAGTGEAQIRVAFVRDRSQADLLVHRVSSRGLARGDALWLITLDKQDATVWIFPCSTGQADVSVCFVDSHSDAGWQRPHRFQGRFAGGK